MKKSTIIQICILLALLTLGFLGIRSCDKNLRNLWEVGLRGPFLCQPYQEELPNKPVSTLKLKNKASLAVYDINKPNPVLVCRSPSGDIVSKTLLIPSDTDKDGVTITYFVHNFVLDSPYQCAYRTDPDLHIYIHCQWEWGGKEGGLVVINPDYSFKELWLSW